MKNKGMPNKYIVAALAVVFIAPLFSSLPSSVESYAIGMHPIIINPLSEINPQPEPLKGSDPSILWEPFQAPNTSLIYNTLELGEVNLDGKLDMLTGYDGQGIVLWLGNGGGTWVNVTTTPTNTGNYKDLSVGDINNDGKPDIVGARQGGISAWFGDGSGISWSADLGPFATSTFNAISLADVNLDGNLDIASAAIGSGIRKGIQVFLGNGLGGWSNGDTNMPLNARFNGISVGDFNNDGKPDIAAAGESGVDAWTGNGAGTWVLSDNGLAGAGSFSDVKFADFDLDGNLDIIATGGNNNGVIIWRGNGAGLWTGKANLPLTGTYTGVETADINIDGYTDIITTSTNSDQVIWTGDGAFNWYLQTNGLPSGNAYSDISIGDIDMDGHIDISIARTSAGIEMFTSYAFRQVNEWVPFNAPIYSGTVNDVEIMDVNLDGMADICYATQTDGIRIWAGNGNGTWANFTSPISTGTVFSIVSPDYNNDGKPDLIATQNNGIRAWRGNAAGTWTQTSSGLSSSGTWYGLASADFNDDGMMDIAAGSGTNSGLIVWNGNGAGVWSITINLPFTGIYHEIETGDINRDGSIDLITANGGLKVFLGNSNNGWTDSSSGLPGVSSQYKSVRVLDLDNNGILDIIGVSETAGANTWAGDGTGQWYPGTGIIPSHAKGISVADFSIDGINDVCIGSVQNTGLKANMSSGSGWYAVPSGLPLTGNYSTIEMADINIDGRYDIITYNNTGLVSRIWIGEYAAPVPETFHIGPLSVGWNLVSIPLMPENTSMPAAITDLDNDTIWTTAKSYSPLDSADPWKSYSIGRPESLQDLTEIDETCGIWLFIPNSTYLGDGYIRIQGFAPSTTDITLNTGWTLVGYPSTQISTASDVLPANADIVSAFQTSSPYISDVFDLSLVTFEPGKGYWVHVSSDCVWSVEF